MLESPIIVILPLFFHLSFHLFISLKEPITYVLKIEILILSVTLKFYLSIISRVNSRYTSGARQ